MSNVIDIMNQNFQYEPTFKQQKLDENQLIEAGKEIFQKWDQRNGPQERTNGLTTIQLKPLQSYCDRNMNTLLQNFCETPSITSQEDIEAQ